MTLTDPVAILAILCLNIVFTEWLVRNTLCRHAGTALLVILVTAAVANLGLIPANAKTRSASDAPAKRTHRCPPPARR